MNQAVSGLPTIEFIPQSQGAHWLVAGETLTVKVSGHDTAGGLLLLEAIVPPGGGPKVLARHSFLEVFRVLEGEFEFYSIDEAATPRTIRATAGDTVLVPPLAWHRYRNVGPNPGRLFTIFNTPVIENLAEAIGQRIEDPNHPPVPQVPTPDGLSRAGELIKRYQIETRPVSQEQPTYNSSV